MAKYKKDDRVLVQLWNTYERPAVKHGKPFETVITQQLDPGVFEIEHPGGTLSVSLREIVRKVKSK